MARSIKSSDFISVNHISEREGVGYISDRNRYQDSDAAQARHAPHEMSDLSANLQSPYTPAVSPNIPRFDPRNSAHDRKATPHGNPRYSRPMRRW